MNLNDLSRKYMISVCAAGSFHIREPGAKSVKGTLPVFSTDTREEAESLRVYHCRLARDGSGLYFLNEPPAGVEGLAVVSSMLRASWEKRRAAQMIEHRVAEVKSGRAARETNPQR